MRRFLPFALYPLVVGCAGLAETTYEGELARCVDQARTLEESHACRADKDRKWNVTRDAGSDGAP